MKTTQKNSQSGVEGDCRCDDCQCDLPDDPQEAMCEMFRRSALEAIRNQDAPTLGELLHDLAVETYELKQQRLSRWQRFKRWLKQTFRPGV